MQVQTEVQGVFAPGVLTYLQSINGSMERVIECLHRLEFPAEQRGLLVRYIGRMKAEFVRFYRVHAPWLIQAEIEAEMSEVVRNFPTNAEEDALAGALSRLEMVG